MAVVSFTPHREDAVLGRALDHVALGSYVDVGAGDPDVHSVTRAFYARGWRGVNVATRLGARDLLKQFRPRDVNLEWVGSPQSEDAPGWLDRVSGEVHFLRIAAPGAEGALIESLVRGRHRPWIVLVESPVPSGLEDSPDWERSLFERGYRFMRRLGTSRFYAALERTEIHEALGRDDGFEVAISERDRSAAEERRLFLTQRDRLLSVVTAGTGGFDAKKHRHLAPHLAGPLPTLDATVSQLCTQSQFDEPLYARWCNLLEEGRSAHRKQWEFVYIMQALWSRGLLRPGVRALGFGCGNEPLASAMAAYGCEVVATDLDPEDQRSKDWRDTDQHAAGRIEVLNARRICPPDEFSKRVSYRNVDMNHIPEDLRGFDFVWSSCALEHIGSIRHGLDFIRNSTKCLKPGGWAVHTTEFNLSSNEKTLESPSLSFFRAYDLEKVAAELYQDGHAVEPFNFNPGDTLLDRYVDLPPYEPGAIHLRLRFEDYTITSVGMIVRKAGDVPKQRESELTESEAEAHDAALAPLVAALEADPGNPACFLGLARALAAVGDFARARQSLEVGLDQNPKDATLWQALIDQSASRGDASRAAHDAADALAQLPFGGEGAWHLRVARALLAGGAVDDACAIVEEALSAFPDHARLLQLQAALPVRPSWMAAK